MRATEPRQGRWKAPRRLWISLRGRLGLHKVYLKQPNVMKDVFSGELAERWSEFVECKKRLRTLGNFLGDNLHPSGRVLDAAAGTGCDAGWLAAHGYDVTANEISADMRKQFPPDLAQRSNARVTAVDWFEFTGAFRAGQFSALLLLGNTLCLLPDKEAMKSAIKNFSYVLANNARIIADERNFGFILENPKEVLSEDFRYSTDVMYCGTGIYAKPIDINGDRVTFGYFNSVDNRIIGELNMYAFRNNEFVELIERQGFQLSCSYSDLKPGIDPTAAFFTYVFDRR